MNRAIAFAKESTERHKHACLIVRGGSLQAFGINSNRNIPGIVQEIDDLAIHAEIAALKVCNRTDDAVAYIARVNARGKPGMSRPCPKCMQALKEAGIKKIVYTVNTSEIL